MIEHMIKTFLELGFVVHPEKSDWTQVTETDIRGLRLIKKGTGTFWSIPENKIERLRILAGKSKLTEKELERALGYVNFAQQGSWILGGATSCFMIALKEARNGKVSKSPRFVSHRPAIEKAISFIKRGQLKKIFDLQESLILFTDASSRGGGGVLTTWDGTVIKELKYKRHDSEHINVAEIEAIRRCIVDWNLSDIDLFVMCDNTTANAAIRKGFSGSLAIRKILEKLFEQTTKRKIGIKSSWIGTNENTVADKLSRDVEWSKEDLKAGLQRAWEIRQNLE